jgi:exodeoxyribonuclease VII large subunit
VSVESRAERLVAEHGGPDALSITQFYQRVDRAIRSSFPEEVWITGEIRSMKILTRGHCFIDLVDPTNARDSGAPTLNVKCWSTQWRSVCATLDRLGITLDAGMVVRVRGAVQFYKARGTVDFILSELDTDALLGKVAAERARLIQALVDENLFDRQRRLPTAVLALRIGLVASPGTEGCNDLLGGLRSAGLAFAVTVARTAVQGKGAPAKVASAIDDLQAEPLDVIVVVRGGGSKADLSVFDHEAVARSIANSEIPVWTGIGHTGDQSVADEVANRTFITPTECGQELARLATEYLRSTVDRGQIAARMASELLAASGRSLDRRRRGTSTGARSQLDRHSERLIHRAHTVRGTSRAQVEAHRIQLTGRGYSAARSATRVLTSSEQELEGRAQRIAALPARSLDVEERRVLQWRRLLGAYDYERQLERGYSVTRDETGRVVRSVDDVAPGASVVTRVGDGEMTSTVTGTRPGRTDVQALITPGAVGLDGSDPTDTPQTMTHEGRTE